MKKFLSFLVLGMILMFPTGILADKLVILHTNDTHSTIDADKNGYGDILQRKALIDSIRAAEPNVILVDAGDVVQGSLYFKFFRGEVEYPLMDKMGYDIRILGNHEFDNGIEDIAEYYSHTSGTPLSANYDFTGTVLDGIFSPYTIREVGGKKIGFFGINVDPKSLIDSKNTGGLRFKEIIPVANETAEFLKKKKKCDLVVAVTHIGVVKDSDKTTDYELAAASKDIDIIIGGHSHTVISPGNGGEYPSIVSNAKGKPVLVAQTGKYSRNLGYIAIDLDKLKKGSAKDFDYQLIPVTNRFPESSLDREIIGFLEPYKQAVDSVNRRVIAYADRFLSNTDRAGGLANFTADMAYDYARHKADSLRSTNPAFPEVDFAIMNVGGIRQVMDKGEITEGQILSTYPFSNHLAIASLKGSDLIEAMRISAMKGGEAVSKQLLVIDGNDSRDPLVLIDGYPVDPDRVYTYATIDYLLGGNDNLTSLANSETLWRDEVEVAAPILRYIENMGELGITVNPDPRPRFIKSSK